MLVTPDMRLKVADFGIARALATIQADEKNEVVWGSPQYIAPEQASGSAPSPASDVYSLGIILYEMLTGSLPFSGSSAAELARKHVEEQPIHLGGMIPDISPALETILSKVLSKEPSRRYRTADQLGRVLLNFGDARSESSWMPTSEAKSLLDPRLAENSQTASNPFALIDWISVGLGLVALTTVLGLIPFWMWIYFVYNPPIR
jgi:serine/threonine-protein kinase